jgi:hypothetical protein
MIVFEDLSGPAKATAKTQLEGATITIPGTAGGVALGWDV